MLRKIDRAYNLFFCFQTLCLVTGTLVVLLAPPGGTYVFIIFLQVIATIIFGIIVCNLSDKFLLEKYPSAKLEISCSAGPGGFRAVGSLDPSLRQQARLRNDHLTLRILRKKTLLIGYCSLIAFFLSGLSAMVSD